MQYDSGTLWRRYGMQCGIQCGIWLPSVCARIPAECEIRSQPMHLPMRCSAATSAATSAGYELALGSSQTCNICLPKLSPDFVLHWQESEMTVWFHLLNMCMWYVMHPYLLVMLRYMIQNRLTIFYSHEMWIKFFVAMKYAPRYRSSYVKAMLQVI